MEFDPEAITSGQRLVQQLDNFNPWWDGGKDVSVTGDFPALRSDFDELLDRLHESDQRLVPITGPTEVGKSSLLRQLISALIDPEFLEKFVRDPDRRARAREQIVEPTNVLYVPLGDDPIFQLRPTEQIRAAVDHFETHVVTGTSDHPHYVFLDDINGVERPSKRGNTTVGRWEQAVAELLTADDCRRIVLTALDRAQVRNRLESTDLQRNGSASCEVTTQLLPMGFADFLRMRHRGLTSTLVGDRFNATPINEGLREAVRNGAVQSFASRAEAQLSGSILDGSTARRELTNFATVGGSISLRLASEGVQLGGDRFVDVIRGRAEIDFRSVQKSAIADFRDHLLWQATSLGQVNDVSGLERLCALAAYERPTGNVPFKVLTDVLDIDRRTLRGQYINVLSRLHVLSAASEYDNQRPRNLRLFLRNTGITNAFCGYDLNDVLRGEPGLDESLAKAIAFDHTIRLSEALNHPRDPKRGVVKFWTGPKGSVDFVPKIDGIPVPMLWSYHRGLDELQRSADTPGFNALLEFLEGNASESERDGVDELMHGSVSEAFAQQRREYVQQDQYAGYLGEEGRVVFDNEPAFGVVLTNTRSVVEQGISVFDGGPKPIVQMPLWVYLRLP